MAFQNKGFGYPVHQHTICGCVSPVPVRSTITDVGNLTAIQSLRSRKAFSLSVHIYVAGPEHLRAVFLHFQNSVSFIQFGHKMVLGVPSR